MRRGARRSLAVAVAAGIAAAAGAAPSRPPAEAPGVELQAASGPPVRLADLKGRVVLVDFWASWCAPCQASFPALDALYRRHHGEGLEVLAVNVDEERKAALRFLAERPHEMPVFFDPQGRAPLAFGVESMPSSYLIDRSGHVRFTHQGYTAATGAAVEREVQVLLSEEAPDATR